MDVRGNVGVALNAESGSSIHIVVNNSPNPDVKLIGAVSQLLKLANNHDLLETMQNISHELYGAKLFKSLTLEQVESLIAVANHIIIKLQATVADAIEHPQRTPTQEGPKGFWQKLFNK